MTWVIYLVVILSIVALKVLFWTAVCCICSARRRAREREAMMYIGQPNVYVAGAPMVGQTNYQYTTDNTVAAVLPPYAAVANESSYPEKPPLYSPPVSTTTAEDVAKY